MVNIQEKIWNNDWFIGVAVGTIVLLLGSLNYLQPFEQNLYNLNMQYTHHDASNSIALIAIDDKTVDKLNNLAWSRRQYAELIDLVAPHAKVMASTLSFSQVNYNINLDNINELMDFYDNSQLKMLAEDWQQLSTLIDAIHKSDSPRSQNQTAIDKLAQFYHNHQYFAEFPQTLLTFEEKLKIISEQLDDNQLLINSLKKAGNVVLNLSANNRTATQDSLPESLKRHGLNAINWQFDSDDSMSSLPQINYINTPSSDFIGAAQSVAISKAMSDYTTFPLVLDYKDVYFPTLPLLLAARSLNLNNKHIEISLGKGVRLGDLRIRTDKTLQIQPFFYSNNENFQIYSFIDVLSGDVAAETFKDKIVLFGMTAQHHTEMYETPLGRMPKILVYSHVLANILNQDFLITPAWAVTLEIILLILSVIYLSLLLPILKTKSAMAASTGLFLVLFLLSFNLFNHGLSISLVAPMLSLFFGHSALTIKRGAIAYQDAFRLHPDAVESNRLLGLAFQGQGQLDMAFEKFRLCPPDDAIMGLLYNLALDCELKGRLRQAAAIYRYMSKHDSNFRDIEKRSQRLQRSKKQGPRGSSSLNNWLSGQSSEKPILGRYQLEKQLGKGAMGQVYLGRDPKLNRVVAIKTLALSQEFEDDALEEATNRFFREAAAAGRLKHTNIISIYDAGEDHDLAYISMEFFKGGNLVPYTKPENLLDISKVIDIVVKISDALDYAHQQGVVHRDIKPANIMYNPATEEIKIADFGIAHITDSNKTKTGIILGTPLYMSPEQLAGKKLNGRTDIFSLGVMLYQLLTAELPFQADSMATLMFKIANEPHTDIVKVRPDIPECIRRIVNKVLKKDTRDRYQTGAELSQALRNCHSDGENG